MNRIALILMLVATCGIAGFALQQRSASATSGPCDPNNASVSPAEQQLFDSANAWRTSSLGQPPMQRSGPVDKAAQWFAEQMIAGAASGHIDRYGRSFNQRLADCGYDAFWSNGSGEALGGFGSSDPSFGSTPAQALAWMTASTPGHQNGLQAPVAWQCGGVGYSSNPNPAVGQLRFAWVVVVAQFGSTSCPQAVTSGPSASTPTATNTNTPTATPTKTPTPTPTPTPSANYNSQIRLNSGWNLETLPAGPLADILDTARGCFSAVYQMDGDHWRRYVPDAPAYASNLSNSSGGAFWVLGTEANCGLIRI